MQEKVLIKTSSDSADYLLQQLLERIINSLLNAELTAYLDYEKKQHTIHYKGNARNGYYKRKLHSRFGPLQVYIPRDRFGNFQQQTLPFYKRTSTTAEKIALQLFYQDISKEDIHQAMQLMYGAYYPKECVSQITEMMTEKLSNFHASPVNDRYETLTLHAPCTKGLCPYGKETCCLVTGTASCGNCEVLYCNFFEHKGHICSSSILENLKSRGLNTPISV